MRLAGGLAVFATALLAHANTLYNGFVFDDLPNIVRNPWIKDVRFLPEIFSNNVAGFDPQFQTAFFRPAMHLLYMVSYAVFGLRPTGYHAVNLLFHAGASVLAFLVARELARRGPRSKAAGQNVFALATGLLFAVHPIHTEAVAWLAGITELSFTAFALGSFALYLHAEQGGAPYRAASAGCFLAALLCKETAVALLPLIVVYEATRADAERAPIARRMAERLWPLGLALGAYLALRVRALGGVAAASRDQVPDLAASLASALDLLARYLGKLVWPFELSAFYAFRPVDSLLDGRLALATITFVGLLAAAWIARRSALTEVGLGFLILPLLPALYIPALGEAVFAERYLYLPTLGFAMLVATGMRALWSRWPAGRPIVVAALGAVLCVYAAVTIPRNAVWRDGVSLWSDAVEEVPDSAVAHEYLCSALYDADRTHEALRHCRRALEIDPARVDARVNLATILSVLGDLDGAIAEFDEALRLRPNSAEAHTNLGLVYMAKGWIERAIREYRIALEVNPVHAEAYNDLGVALALSGNSREAIEAFSEAVRLAPDQPEYAANLDHARTAQFP